MLVALVTLVGGTASARAGAIGVGTTVASETALLRTDGGLQTTVVGIQLAPSTGEDDRPGAVVLPVPVAAEATPVAGDAAQLLNELEAATRPRTVASETARQAGDEAALRAPELRFADYTVTTFPAGDLDGLSAWLGERGRTSPAARSALRRYAADGWAFVALALDEPVEAAQALRPLRLEFASQSPQYPLRTPATLGTSGPDPVLYVAGPHRVIAPGFDTHHAGWIVDLDPSPSPDGQALLGDEEFLTKLGRSRGGPPATADLRTEQGVSDRLFRASADFPFESEAGFATAPLPPDNAPEIPFEGPPGWLWLVVLPVVVLLVGGTGLLLRWRNRGA